MISPSYVARSAGSPRARSANANRRSAGSAMARNGEPRDASASSSVDTVSTAAVIRATPACDAGLVSARSRRTALLSNQPLGSAEVTHPFHPLRGQKLVVLKVRTVSGVETLSVRHPDLGSVAMPRDWTDWGCPGTSATSSNNSLMVDVFGFAELARIVDSLTRDSKRA
jgi:Family of unknown function (DUF5372)